MVDERDEFEELENSIEQEELESTPRSTQSSKTHRPHNQAKRTEPKRLSAVSKIVIGLLTLLVILISLSEDGKKEEEGATSRRAALKTPQGRFENTRADFYQQYLKAKNDIAKESVFEMANRWTGEFAEENEYIVENWKGTVTSITAGDDEAGIKLSSEIMDIEVEYLDMSVQKGSTVYYGVKRLADGDRVYFSGALNIDSEKGIKEASFTQSGSMENPEFYITLLSIGKERQYPLSDREKKEIFDKATVQVNREKYMEGYGEVLLQELHEDLKESILTYTTLRMDDYDKGGIRLALRWIKDPISIEDIVATTRAVAEIVLEKLVKQGRNPSEEWFRLSVWAEKAEKGATGKNMVRVYGRISYDFNSDSLKWLEYE